MSDVADVLEPVFTRRINQALAEKGAGLSAEQLQILGEVFRSTLDQYWKPGGHILDRRGRLPLYFISFYYVFLFGRDRRASQRRKEHARRFGAEVLGNTVFVMVVLSPFAVLLLVVLYLVKMYLGIDLFPDFHLPGALGIH